MNRFDFAAEGIDLGDTTTGPEVKALCPKCSHTRKKRAQKCLNANIETGLWHCWHCSFSGKATEVTASRPRTQPTQSHTKAHVRPDHKSTGITTAALKWFANRGITQEVLSRNGVSTQKIFMPQVGQEVEAIAFPYLRGGVVLNYKYRDNAKNFRMVTGGERLLYGYDDIENTTLIVEGECDKLALEVAGLRNCVSVPDGAPAPNVKNIESKFDYLNDARLQEVTQWIIAVDNDPPGQRLQDELIRRFGAEKCSTVTWPEGCKDANETLQYHGPKTLRECIDAAVPVPIVGVFNASPFVGDLMRMYDHGLSQGVTTGWACMDKNWRVEPGQLLVVTGIPGHGKSEWVDALCMNLALENGWSTGLYSPENHPVSLHLAKLAEKYIGKPFNPGSIERMSKSEVADGADWIDQHFYWIQPRKPNLAEIMDKAQALVLRHGIRALVIDPWNEVEHDRPDGMTESEYISQSLSALRRFARKHAILVIVVAHPRLLEKKIDGRYSVPTPYDISGGAMWRNKADNAIAIYADPTDPSGAIEVHVQKVKFKQFGQVGMVKMRWDRNTGRYTER